MDCLFCDLERDLIIENDYAVAVYDTYPVSAGHALVIPKRHATTIFDLSDDEYTGWLKDKQRQLGRDQVSAVAAALGLRLPEIDVEDFRASGYLPGVLNNYLALLGWNPGLKNDDGTDLERFDMDFLAQHFSFDRIGKSNSKFDRDKLLAFNADTIQHGLTDDRFAVEWLTWAERFDTQLAEWANQDQARWQLAAAAARPRTKTFSDAKNSIEFALVSDDGFEYDKKSVKKHLSKGEPSGFELVSGLASQLSSIDNWTPERIDEVLSEYTFQGGHKMGAVAQALRVTVSGVGVTPPLGQTLGILGKEHTFIRIERLKKENPSSED